jgi:hypothetical protein
MNAECLASLRQAASALISTAAPSTVLAALRALLADPAFAVEAPAMPLRPPQSAPELPALRPARDKPAAGAKSAVTPSDPEWEALRSRVKAAMAERGASYADLGQAIGRSAIGMRINLGSRRPPRPIVRTRLQEWLAEEPTGAPGVATAVGTTFRPNGTSRVHANSLGTAD